MKEEYEMVEILKKFFFLPGMGDMLSSGTNDILIRKDDTGPIRFASVVHSVLDHNPAVDSDTK